MIHLGRHSYNYGVQRGTANDVHIGNFSSIAEGVIFDGGFNHDTSFVSTFPFSKIWGDAKTNIKIKGDIIIGNDVWIGEGAIIMSGITIGDGAIIGARSIVTNHVFPFYKVAGSPAKCIGVRIAKILTCRAFADDEKIKKMQKIAWWNWNDEKIKENLPLLQSNNIDEFINKHYKP